MKNLAHSASFHAGEKTAPSKPGIKHLAAAGAPEIVHTVWGFGYTLEDPPPSAIAAARARVAAGLPRQRRAHLRQIVA